MSVGIFHNWAKHQLRITIEFVSSLSLLGPAFTWFSSLPVNSVANWADLEKKFHTYFCTRTREKKITDLITIRQKTNESGTEFFQRFRETRKLCFSLNLANDQLAALAVQEMLSMWKKSCWDKNLTTWDNWLNE